MKSKDKYKKPLWPLGCEAIFFAILSAAFGRDSEWMPFWPFYICMFLTIIAYIVFFILEIRKKVCYPFWTWVFILSAFLCIDIVLFLCLSRLL